MKKSAAKELRKSKKRREQNKIVKNNIKYLKKQILKALAKKDIKSARDIFIKFQKVVDKAAKRGVIKKNTASRYKSRLSKKIKT